MNCILVSELKEFDVSHDLIIHNSKVIINCLVEDHVIDKLLDLLSFSSDSLNAIDVNVL